VIVAFALATLVRLGPEGYLVLQYEYGLAKIGIVCVVSLLCIHYYDLYDSVVLTSRREVFTRLVQAFGTLTLLLAALYYAVPQLRLGQGIFIWGVAFLLVFLFGWRLAFLRLNSIDSLAARSLLLGSGSLAVSLAEEIGRRPELGLLLVGWVDDGSSDTAINGLPRLSGLNDVHQCAERWRVNRIIVALGERRGRLPLEQLLALKTHGRLVQDGTEVYENITGRVHLASLRPSWLLFSPGFRLSLLQQFRKRVASLFGSLIGLILFLPLMLVIALAIKLDTRGPVIFRQGRVGRDRKDFTLYKFRTMHVGADSDGVPKPAVENDVRFTRLGHWLRRTRWDELPQLYNIFRGDMDFVGPRPFLPTLEAEYARRIPFYSQRWSEKPGATGWAQVHRGYCTTVEDNAEKLSYDLFYIKNMSVGLDLLILFQTVKILLLGRGAR